MFNPYPESRHLFSEEFFKSCGIRTIPIGVNSDLLNNQEKRDLAEIKKSQRSWWVEDYKQDSKHSIEFRENKATEKEKPYQDYDLSTNDYNNPEYIQDLYA